MTFPRTLVAILAAVVFIIFATANIARGDGMPGPVGPAAVANCPPGFTSAAKTSPPTAGGGMALSQSVIDQIRVGRHDPCYDRLVIDTVGPVGGFNVRYVNEVTSDPKGDVLTVPGQARLLVVVGNPASHRAGGPQAGDQLIPTRKLTSWVEFRSVIFAGSFESVTSIGLGVAEPRPFRVFVLPPGPGHRHIGMLVVDVAHRG
jgi:hypothetical protein